MTKNRQPISAEYAVKECIRLTHILELKDVIKKSDGYVYKCSDPDEPQEISVRDALLMDEYVHARAGGAPFRELFIRNIEREKEPIDGDLRDCILRVQSDLGQLSSRIRDFTSPTSDGGKKLTPNERQSALVELEQLQRTMHDIFNLLQSDKGV